MADTDLMWKPEKDFAGSLAQGARPSQQDAYAFSEPSHGDKPGDLLLVLADGMGGHQGGSVASRTAVESYFDAWFETTTAPLLQQRMLDCLEFANRCIEDTADQADGTLDGMGCTLVAVFIRQRQLSWISVGDSPMWLFREGKLDRLNAEHSMRPILASRVAAGQMTADQAACHPERNHLISALVGAPITMIDAPDTPISLQPGDIILAASDGILTLSENSLQQLLSNHSAVDAGDLAQLLLDAVAAEEHPKQDNTTVAIIRVPVSIS